MKYLFSFLFFGILFTSCMDVTMEVEVDNTGGIAYSGEVDVSSMMPMINMAFEMQEESDNEPDPLEELLRAGTAVDTIISIFDLEEGMGEGMKVTQEIKDKFRVRMQIDPAYSTFIMKFATKYEDIEDQKRFLAMIPQPDSTGEAGIGGDPDMLGGMLATDLNIEEGFMIFKTKLNEKVESDAYSEGMDFPGTGFGDAIEPNLNLNLTLPGKVKGVVGADYRKISDWKINLKIPLETDDPEKEYVRINFEPISVFSKPEVTEVWDPKPEKISFIGKFNVPSDAIVLLGEKGTGAWTHINGNAANWDYTDGVMTVRPGTGDIHTKEIFGDCQLHVEWRVPKEKGKDGQGKGNSGIYLQSLYEVQVLDSYKNETYSNGQAGSIYKQAIPAVNASLAPGEWQAYDIVYRAPRFDKLGIKESAARITVIHNGVIIHNDQEIKGTTEYRGLPKNPIHSDAPLKLQDHSNKISYRNIWIRKL